MGWLWLQYENLFKGHCVGSVGNCGTNIFRGQSGIRVKQVGFGSALAEFAQQQLHRDSGPADDRFPEHNLGVHFDSISDGHVVAP